MARSYARLFAVIFCLAIALGFVGPAGVAHAEPGPRPTLTPIPPMAEPVVVPEEEAEPVPTGRPRRTFRVVLTPVAPVQATALPESVTDLMIQPSVQAPDVQVRYVVPGQAVSGVAAVASPVQSTTLFDDLLSYRALLIGLITLNVIGICLLLRRRFATM